MPSHAADLARRLARDAEAVCRHYLSNGHRRVATGWSAMSPTLEVGACLSDCTALTMARVPPASGLTPLLESMATS